ncbi:phosphate signaling complex PhoU family protein [Nocardia huaxiensis]|uniref:Phosphate uptake regulator, PhoU n=1 Tax=Nocardia huaxiensis TaxID=2755382 RepID=A0A7D6ZM37_9NOCA|nr:PhoU domain-containing protein [Nocardia huaxiensis]QLY33020.1 phosphate uptake regulator, PhoU [Nocardia huaxiensis]UFS93217.1 phosphate uptake regulator, PhoU [Nocardia huaxiensis]
MRTKFSIELMALTDELAHMARLTHEAAERTSAALAGSDLTAAYEVFALEEQIQVEHAKCEDRSVILLALEAPVARDLRHVVTAMQIADDLLAVSDALSRVADNVVRRYPEPVAPQHVVDLLVEIAGAAITIVETVVGVIAAQSPPRDQVLVTRDERMDRLRAEVLEIAADAEWSHGSAMAIDLAMLVHHYGRCVDHSVRVGRLIRFFHTGIPLYAQVEA